MIILIVIIVIIIHNEDTIAGRWVLNVRTVWKTSTTPSYCIRSRTIDNEMKTPVRPTPALWEKRKLGFDYEDDYNDFDCNDNDDDIFPFYVCLT